NSANGATYGIGSDDVYQAVSDVVANPLSLPAKEPPSRNLPWGVSLISANFSTGPIPGGSGGSPHGCTGPAFELGAGICATADPATPQMMTNSQNPRAAIRMRVRMA